MEQLIITPKTKIYDMLEAYPQLEDVLVALAPPFKKLKNPVLRKTITKITSLSQAAVIGGLKVEDLIIKLRSEIGQASGGNIDEEHAAYLTKQPDWFNEDHIAETIDIRDMLNAGEQPVHEVLSAIKKLDDNKVLELIAPFIPAPLIDKASGMNYMYWLDDKGNDEYRVYFKK